MDGKYSISIEHIRTLAITCHALDGQFDSLFNSEAICGQSEAITDSYNRLLHTSLLNLAVSIRVSLSDEPEYSAKHSGSACVLVEPDARNKHASPSIKDVCDKIIHAAHIFKAVEHGVVGACSTLRGSKSGTAWEWHLGITIFCELVLRWLSDIEGRAGD